jgi:outer membrane protein OmpA-like peptidoglycan-associated protein
MSGFTKFFIGLALLWLMAVAARYVQGEALEADLKARSLEALKTKGYDDVDVAFNIDKFGFRRVAVLSGAGATPEKVAEAKKAVGSLLGVNHAVWQGDAVLAEEVAAPAPEPEVEPVAAAPVEEEKKEEAPAPYKWSVRKEQDGRILLTGMVPDEDSRKEIVAYAKEQFPDATVDDALQITDGYDASDWVILAKRSLRGLKPMISGEATFDVDALSLEGVVDDAALKEKTADSFQEEVKALDKDVEFNADIMVREAPAAEAPKEEPTAMEVSDAKACQETVEALLKDKTILFDTAKATLKVTPNPLLDELANALGDCPDASVRVEGHTDLQGDATKNQQLSERRAVTVVQYLTKAGLQRDRFKAVGYGESRLLDKGDSAEAYARNRRIEFKVQAR